MYVIASAYGTNISAFLNAQTYSAIRRRHARGSSLLCSSRPLPAFLYMFLYIMLISSCNMIVYTCQTSFTCTFSSPDCDIKMDCQDENVVAGKSLLSILLNILP